MERERYPLQYGVHRHLTHINMAKFNVELTIGSLAHFGWLEIALSAPVAPFIVSAID